MKNIIVVKAQDRGGSYFIKNELLPKFQNGRLNFIYDINNEYGQFHNNLNDYFDELPDVEEFMSVVPHDTNSFCNVVFEEATGFFSNSGSGSKKILRHITRRFHTQNLNIFIFHSLLKIPNYIYDYMDFIVLFKTDDDQAEVHKSFKSYPKIIEAFDDVKNKTDNTYFNREKKIYAVDAATPVDAARDCAAAPVCLHALPGDDPTGLPCGDLTNACGTTLGCNVTNGGATACMGAPPGTACINNVCARCGVPTDACGLAGCCPHGCTYPGVGAPTCLP